MAWMTVTPIKVIVVLFVLFAYSRAFLRLRDNQISFREFMFWTVVWVGVLVVTFVPSILNYLSSRAGVGRGADLLVYLSILLLFYLTFRMYVKLDEVKEDVTKIVRKVALEEVEKEREDGGETEKEGES